MAETCSKWRLVRCPKCENLLPELPDYSVYQCGGCGAVLRAAKKATNVEGTNGLKKDNEDKIGAVCDKSDTLLTKSKEVTENVEIRLSDNEGINKSDNFSSEPGNGVKSTSDIEENVEIVAQRFGNDFKREVSNETDVSNGNVESKVDKLEPHVENSNLVRRSGRLFEHKMSDRKEEERYGRVRKGFERLWLSNLSHVGEGSSKYELDSNYCGEPVSGTRPEFEDHDKEELLRKLDELKEKLSRVQGVNEKPRERSPLERKMAHVEPYYEPDDYFRYHTSRFDRVGPPYMEPYCDRYNRPRLNMYNYHGSIQTSNHVPRYEDSFEPHMLRRPPPRTVPHHHQYVGPDPESFDPHPYNTSIHHRSCSCYHCHDRKIPSSGFGNRGFPNKGVPHHHGPHPCFGPQRYNPRVVNVPPISSCEPPPRAKWPTEPNPKIGPAHFSRARPQRVVLTSGHRSRPIGGGAPFITCPNCLELLKLPGNVRDKNGEWKLSCGSCSSVNTFIFEDENLVFVNSVNTCLNQATNEPLLNSNDVVCVNVKRDNTSLCSEEYANSIYDFQPIDREPISSSTSEDLIQGVTSTDEPLENGASSPSPRGSPLQDNVDYGSMYRAVNRCGKGNLSSRSDQERVVSGKSIMRQNSLKDSLATEIDISLNEYANNGVAQDNDEEQPKGKKGGDSFLTGIIKKSFRGSNQTLEDGKRNVTVNGHVISDKLVKKAEKMAGPIYPGQYWYDYRAGFWGVMGGPCLGIIPPYIEEFSYPIPENCAGGNTGVFVNGRELHQKDFKLLSTRGLPPAKGRSYIIEISGKVVDEDTGEELDSLGKLAPTVEKVKHGFGMRPPKARA